MTNLLVILFSSKNLKIKKYKTQETQIGNFLLYKNNINEYCIIICLVSIVLVYYRKNITIYLQDRRNPIPLIVPDSYFCHFFHSLPKCLLYPSDRKIYPQLIHHHPFVTEHLTHVHNHHHIHHHHLSFLLNQFE